MAGSLERVRAAAPMGMAVAFAVSGLVHLVRPATYRPIMPRVLPRPDAWIIGSGVAELGLAVGLARRERWAGPASAALLVGVLPAHLQMLADAGTHRYPGPLDSKAVAWGRLPLQAPMIWAVLQSRPRPAREVKVGV